ncbi:MAG: hypothetical protein NXH73_07140 [Flavobacteriaceae bacterium]|nr:hypothetical protein [Flavobacteriaceae bacterium]
MKSKHLLSIFSALFMSLLLFSCSSDDDSNSGDSGTVIAQLETSIKSGNWRVSNFLEDGNNQTSNFNGYVFTFGDNGSITAENGSTTKTGTWVTGIDDSTPKFIINFPDNNGPFEEISEDWRIENSTNSKIDLKHVSGGDGSIDLLSFTKI